ncbi:MAG: hypothetical protein IJJ43_08470 [Oscillospiraceae bacterium]|nr:hypothetical protein [Oscillospiraceae bacterium]
MKSKTSFFNAGVSRSLLRRFWPIWAAWFGVLLLALPVNLASKAQEMSEYALRTSWEEAVAGMDLSVAQAGMATVFLSAFAAVIAAMAMFHYLYQSKSCGMMNSLPVKRETMFCTAWLTGLVPLLLADLLAALLTALLYCTRGFLHVRALLEFFALAAMGNIAFYGFAVFCAMLTGNLLVLPAVYAVLNFTAAVAEGSARELLSTFVFGMRSGGSALHFLSPPVRLMEKLGTSWIQPYGYELNGLGALAAYAAAGLVLSGAALLLYKRRKMETAGDVVAIRVLKPVFKYCLCFGTALVFANVTLQLFYRAEARGLAAAGLVLGLMLIGGFIGYFAAEMLIQKTLKVFRGKWKGFAVACAVIALFVGMFEFDLTGYEKRVPAPEDVELVSLWSVGDVAELRDPALIAETTDFHRAVIENKAACEAGEGDGGAVVTLSYFLNDGRELHRSYRLPEAGAEAPDSLTRRAEALLNAREAILARAMADLAFTGEWIIDAGIDYGVPEESPEGDFFAWTGLVLTQEEAMSLYREGILPDAEAGHIGLAHLVRDETYYENIYPINISFTLRDPETEDYRKAAFRTFYVERDSVNTLRWLAEHTGIELRTWAELGADIGQQFGVKRGVG